LRGTSNISCLPQRRGEPLIGWSTPVRIVFSLLGVRGRGPQGGRRVALRRATRNIAQNNGDGSCCRNCEEGFAWVSLFSVGFRTTRFTDGMLHPKAMRHQCFLGALMIVSPVILIVLSNSLTECCYILPISAWMLAVFVCHTICTQSTRGSNIPLRSSMHVASKVGAYEAKVWQ
jgi:hypothetical protein